MPDVTNSSFIPKRTPTQKTRPTRRKNFFLFSIVSYAMFVAAPIASGVVFIYERYTEKIFNQAVVDLDASIQNFNEADLERVIEFDARTKQVEEFLFGQVSFTRAIQILEENITPGIQFLNLKFTHTESGDVLVSASAAAENFDAVLFQKELVAQMESITKGEVIKFTYTPPNADTASDEVITAANAAEEDSDKPIKFSLLISIPSESIVVADRNGPTINAPIINTETFPVSPSESLGGGASGTPSVNDSDSPSADANADTI
jgi:hypothetical protein